MSLRPANTAGEGRTQVSTADDRLFEEWERLPHHDHTTFVRDGIIDTARWNAATRKLLFVLKEAYDGPGDLRIWPRDEWKGPRGHTFLALSQWAYLALRASARKIPPFPNRPRHTDELKDALLSSAVVNIKKSGGKKASDWNELKQYAQRDAKLIRQQIELIKPEIVICGNVWSLIKDPWPDARNIYDDLVHQCETITIVDFWHPAMRVAANLKYYALAALLQNSGALGPLAS